MQCLLLKASVTITVAIKKLMARKCQWQMIFSFATVTVNNFNRSSSTVKILNYLTALDIV